MKLIFVGAILSGLVTAQVPLEQEPRHHIESQTSFYASSLRRFRQVTLHSSTYTLTTTQPFASTARKRARNNRVRIGAMWEWLACPAESESLSTPESLARICAKSRHRRIPLAAGREFEGNGRITSLWLFQA